MITKHAKNAIWLASLFVVPLLIQGCGDLYPLRGQAVEPKAMLEPCDMYPAADICASVDGITLLPPSNVQRGSSLMARVTGKGTCSLVRIKWGDSSIPDDVRDINFDINPGGVVVTHTYGYWGGPKTVTAQGITCAGRAQASIVVDPEIFRLGFWAPTPRWGRACGILSSVPAVRQNAIVTITTGPTQMDFGCILGGCVYSPDGEPGSVAPSGYPFPGLRKYSLVIRLGSQVIQGSNGFTFVANQNAFMEVCANDNDLRDNSGAWGVFIRMDESGL